MNCILFRKHAHLLLALPLRHLLLWLLSGCKTRRPGRWRAAACPRSFRSPT